MNILPPTERLKLLEFMTRLKYQLAGWYIVEVKLIAHAEKKMTPDAIAILLAQTFQNKEGLVLICGPLEVLMLVEWGIAGSQQELTLEIRKQIPTDVCDVDIAPPTKEGLKKITFMVAPPTANDGSLYAARAARDENIVLIADDDMYMRSLAKIGIKGLAATVVEVSDGAQVLEAYQKHNPDLVLLDIHMPGLNGQEVLARLREIDPKAHVIMLSADSSPENVKFTQQQGAKGFLAKPFNKAKLLEYISACPTIG